MKKKLVAFLLSVALIMGETVTAFAVEEVPISSEIDEEAVTETEEATPTPTAVEEAEMEDEASPSVSPSETPAIEEISDETVSPSPSELPEEVVEEVEEKTATPSESPSLEPTSSPTATSEASASPSASPSATPSEEVETELEEAESEEYVEVTYRGNIDFPYEFQYVSTDGIALEADLPAEYKNLDIPNTRNQGSFGTCWAHSTMALCEINAIKNGYATKDIDLSELHLAYFSYYGNLYDPLGGFDGPKGTHDYNKWVPSETVKNIYDNGGNVDLAINILSSWTGIANETTAPYSSISASRTLSDDIARTDEFHIKNGYVVHLNTQRDIAKKLIMDYGAVSGAFFALQKGEQATFVDADNKKTVVTYSEVYNPDMNCYNFTYPSGTNHAITIVGWNDAFSRENFATEPEGDGAWLIRNSWDTNNSNNLDGYFWMSYYDKSLRDEACAIEVESADIYDNNYQYDGCMMTYHYDINSTDFKYANVFNATNDDGETITGAAFRTSSSNVNYKIEICKGITGNDPSTGTIVATQSGTTTYPGYYTVALEEANQVSVEKGEKFAIIVSLTKDGEYPTVEYEDTYTEKGYNCVAVLKPGQSYKAVSDSDTWEEKETYGNYRIKAFTVNYAGPKKYTLTFDPNGGEVSETSKKVAYETAYGELPIPTRTGYEFLGWFTDPSAGEEVTEGTIYDATTDTTIYAHWGSKGYEVKIYKNGDSTFETKNVKYGEAYGDVLNEPSRRGYKFTGWNTSSDGTGVSLTKDSVVDETAEGLSIYALWEIKEIPVKYDDGLGNVSTVNVEFGEKILDKLPTPAFGGLEFLGWYDGDTKVTEDEVADDQPFYYLEAHWSKKYTTEVPSISPMGGSTKETAVTVEKGDIIYIKPKTVGSVVSVAINSSKEPTTDTMTSDGMEKTELLISKSTADEEGYIKLYVQGDKISYNRSDVAVVWYKVKDDSDDWGDITDDIKTKKEWTNVSDIPEGFWTFGVPKGEDSPEYTGKAITIPNLKVFDGKTLLKETTDYTIKYNDNIKAGKAKITITGKGNYSSSVVEEFTIKQLSLGDSDRLSAPDISVVHTGRTIKGTTTVSYKINETFVTLKNGTDFTFSYEDTSEGAYINANDSGYEVKLIGKGNYTGTACFKESILEKTTSKVLISKTTVEKIPSQPLTGSAVEPRSAIRLKYRASAKEEWKYLEEGEDKDYVVSFTNNINAGTATAIIEGRGNYSGVRYVTFTIAGTPITKAIVEGLPKSKEYTGTALELTDPYRLYIKATKTTSEIPLTKDVDYTVSYLKNVAKGTATVTFTGINGYTGTLKKTFAITAHTLTDADLTAKETSVTYTKGGAVPDVTLTYNGYTLVKGTDYTVSCVNNKAVTTADTTKKPTITITGKGNYTGKLSYEYEITGSDLDNVSMTASSVMYTGRAAGTFKTTVKLTDTDGKVLVAGTDYERNIVYTYAADSTIKVKQGREEKYEVRTEGTPVGRNDILLVGNLIRVTVTGKKNYYTEVAGEPKTKSVIVSVVKYDISKAVVKEKQPLVYDNILPKPGKDDITVTLGGKPVDFSEYIIDGYRYDLKKKIVYVTIRGIENYGYGGTKEVGLKIVPKQMSKAGFSPDHALFVAVNGNDNNPGTDDKPFKSVQAAINMAAPGQTIYLKKGTYSEQLFF